MPVATVDKATLHELICTIIAPTAMVYTDAPWPWEFTPQARGFLLQRRGVRQWQRQHQWHRIILGITEADLGGHSSVVEPMSYLLRSGRT